jgi:hypothetical protein
MHVHFKINSHLSCSICNLNTSKCISGNYFESRVMSFNCGKPLTKYLNHRKTSDQDELHLPNRLATASQSG